MPVDVANGKQAAQSDWNTLGWQSFVALNWPSKQTASGISGLPDTTQKISAAADNAGGRWLLSNAARHDLEAPEADR